MAYSVNEAGEKTTNLPPWADGDNCDEMKLAHKILFDDTDMFSLQVD